MKEGSFTSKYKRGEVMALIAPLLGCNAEELGDVLIIARDHTGSKIGVHHTMWCSQELHAHCKALDLVGEYIQQVAAQIFEESPQHGPGE